jgi:hypothetical protein
MRSVRLRIPVAAFWLKKYFSGTSCVSIHGNNVHAAALLGDSKVFAVKHTPRQAIPELIQRLEYNGEVASSVAREKAVHVFEDNGSWQALSNESDKVMKESRLGPSKPASRPHTRKREILAGETCCPNVSLRDCCFVEDTYIFLQFDVRPMAAQNLAAEGLNFALEHYVEPGLLETKIEPANPGEERGDFVRQSQTSTGNKTGIACAGRFRPVRCQALRSGSPHKMYAMELAAWQGLIDD